MTARLIITVPGQFFFKVSFLERTCTNVTFKVFSKSTYPATREIVINRTPRSKYCIKTKKRDCTHNIYPTKL
jgi:hypothetical protein